MALVDPPAVVEVAPPDPTTAEVARRPVRGIVSIGCAALMILATVAGSLTAGTRLGSAALPLAIAALAFSVVAVILGLAAVVRGPGRALGIVALVVGVVLNPVLLALLLPGAAR